MKDYYLKHVGENSLIICSKDRPSNEIKYSLDYDDNNYLPVYKQTTEYISEDYISGLTEDDYGYEYDDYYDTEDDITVWKLSNSIDYDEADTVSTIFHKAKIHKNYIKEFVLDNYGNPLVILDPKHLEYIEDPMYFSEIIEHFKECVDEFETLQKLYYNGFKYPEE